MAVATEHSYIGADKKILSADEMVNQIRYI